MEDISKKSLSMMKEREQKWNGKIYLNLSLHLKKQ